MPETAGSNELATTESAPSSEFDRGPSLVMGIDFTKLNEKELRIVPDALKNLPEVLEFVPGINLIVGHNAQGKSTLLEAMRGAIISYAQGVTVEEIRSSIVDDVKAVKLHLSLSTAKALETKGIKPFADFKHFDYTESPVENARAIGGFMAAAASTTFHTKSQRESREEHFRRSHVSKVDRSRPILLLLDEPEHGLDPWRHQNIKAMISELASPDSTIIVATNSPVLVADAELPRIDLRYPEDGSTHQVR